MKFQTYNNLKKSSLNPVNLSKFVNFKLSCDLEELNDIKFHWEKVYSVLDNKHFYLPSQFIYNSFEEDEYYIRQPISTGASTWSSNAGAILGGIYEIIERDSFMIFYLNKLSPPKVDLNQIKDKEIHYILEKFNRYKLKVYVLDITSDLNVPTFLTVLIDKTGVGPAISVGNNTNFNINKAIKGSLLEAYKVRLWLRYKKTIFSINPDARKEINTNFLLKRGFLWYNKKMINKINFFIKSNKISNLNKYKEKSKLSIVDSLKEVIQILSEKEYSVFIKDLTNNNFPIYNFKTFKVIIPELHPLYLREGFKYDTGERLTEVPKILGYKTNKKINDFPHPFL